MLGHEWIIITNRYLQSIQDEEVIGIVRSTSPLMNL
ncbi:Phage integrase family protein [Bacillus cereus ATCC 14579]|uniref:Phage integrase family protein n=1 Tax=Bacillus cereus (strain ATCC 14579 / DSM 31 / CCUG 7414 / JCM 2152 / NBRC 15305 / NCIMB 9373 / NCTC 2599 / NRRL B-3711) TaxID=226900 RepID=Q81GE2_BACCR|nr:Phage integrase family protein [Bacillus cereus ATCC 14579]